MDKKRIAKRLRVKLQDWDRVLELLPNIYLDKRMTYYYPEKNTIVSLDEDENEIDPDDRYGLNNLDEFIKFPENYDFIGHFISMLIARKKYNFEKIQLDYIQLPGTSFEVIKDIIIDSSKPKSFHGKFQTKIENHASIGIISQVKDCYTINDLWECPMYWDDDHNIPKNLLWDASELVGLDPRRIFRMGLQMPTKDRNRIKLSPEDRINLINILTVIHDKYKVPIVYLDSWLNKTFYKLRKMKNRSSLNYFNRDVDSKIKMKIESALKV